MFVAFSAILLAKYSESDGGSCCLWVQENMNGIIQFILLLFLFAIPTIVVAGISIAYKGKINQVTDNIRKKNLDYDAVNFTIMSLLNILFFSLNFALVGIFIVFLIVSCNLKSSEKYNTLL